MATKLYTRQGGNLQGIGIRQPLQPDMTKTKILADVSSTFKAMADKNFALGKAELISSVIDNAYQLAPSDPAKFDELIQSNLQKSTADIPNKWREDVLLTAKPKVDATRQKVIQNNIDNLNEEFKTNVLGRNDRLMLEQEDANNLRITAIINEDKDALNSAIAYGNKIEHEMNLLANTTDIKGSYIIGDKATRSMLESGQYNKVDAAKAAINQMDLQTLIDFDTRTFQDREAFKKAYGVTDESYDDISTYITNRRKAMGDEEKRVILAQNQFNAARMVADFSEEELDNISDDAVSKDFKNNIRKAHKKYEGTVNAAFTDDGFLASIQALEDVVMDTGATDPEHNKALLDTAVEALANINTFAGASGMDEKSQAELQRSLYEAISSQEFADSMKPLYSPSMLNSVMSQATDRMKGFVSGSKAVEIKDPFIGQHHDRSIPRALENKASLIIQEAIALSAAGNYEAAQERLKTGNKELIRLNYSGVISDFEFDRLEEDLELKRPAYFTRGGKTWEFMGYDSKDALFKTKM